MKYRELKEKFQHKFSMRMTAGVLCIALAGGSFGISQIPAVRAASADVSRQEAGDNKETEVNKAEGKQQKEEEQESAVSRITSMLSSHSDTQESLDGKEETVYIIADAGGKAGETIVSSWLKNGSGRVQISDVSSLKDIENVKGDETFSQNGEQITWEADGGDIYYRGTTDQELPITQTVTYYLDGAEIQPEELAGKSGQVKIRFDYKNNAKTKAVIDGKEQDIYVPFTVISGMVFDDSFRNVKINNGKILSDGNRIIAAGFAVPGLKESLDVKEEEFDEDFDFPESVEVTADVENFSLEMTMTAAVPGLLSDSDLSEKLDLSGLDEKMDEMSDAVKQLEDGSGELADGLGTLSDSMKTFAAGVSSLRDGVNAYTDGASRLADGIQSLDDHSGTLEAGVNTLNGSAKTISSGVQKLDQTLNRQMTEKEKEAVKQQVDQTVDAQFQKGSESYEMIYNAAVQNFHTAIASEASVNAVQAGIQAGMQAQGLTSEGVVAALAQYYAANGFTDSSGKQYPAEVCQTNVPGTETSYAVYFASSVLNGGLSSALAGSIAQGMEKQGAPAAAQAVVDACHTAAKQAGEAAAVSGAEAAKKQIVAAIEEKDSESGYSLVSGTRALQNGTQQLADSVPALRSGIRQLSDGAQELAGKSGALKNGVSELSDGTAKISEGTEELKDGAQQLKDGLKEFNEEAVSKIVEAYNGDIKDLTQRLKAVLQAADNYGTFCGAAEGTETSSKFIFRTDAVKAEDAE